ncbi:MAG: glutathione S-transferase family protein [Pseudomonadota bacterium]
MTEFRLHCFAQSGNAYKAALMLALAKADWEPVFVDFFNGETRADPFRALNVMGEVPVLEHRGEVITQSGAILDYLAAVTGQFDPGPENQREAMRWMLFDSQKVSGQLGTWRFMLRFLPEDKRSPDVIAFLEKRARTALQVLDAHLADRDWLAAEWMTIADLAAVGYLFFEDEYPVDWPAEYPNLTAWRERIHAEDGWAHPYDLMPGHPLP